MKDRRNETVKAGNRRQRRYFAQVRTWGHRNSEYTPQEIAKIRRGWIRLGCQGCSYCETPTRKERGDDISAREQLKDKD